MLFDNILPFPTSETGKKEGFTRSWQLLRNTEDGSFYSEMLVKEKKRMINGVRSMYSIFLTEIHAVF